MVDIADHADELIEAEREQCVKRAAGKPFDPGEPGECLWCGYWNDRLVRGVCARCRDERRLP
jgi:hypothetical protein